MRNFASLLHNAAGLPDIFCTTYQKGKNIPNYLKIYQIAIKQEWFAWTRSHRTTKEDALLHA
jgi:hypothetical protein